MSRSSDREGRSASARPSTPPPATVAVLLPLPLDRAYDYAVPEELAADIAPGSFVRVPLGRVERIGVVWGEGEGDVEPARLKPVTAVLESPPMTEPLRRLIDWAADYTLAQRGAVLRMAMSVPAAVEPPPMRTAYRRGQDEAPRMTEARSRVLALLQDGPPRTAAEIARKANVGTAVVRGLAALGTVEAVSVREVSAFGRPDTRRAGPILSDAQADAANALREAVAAGEFSVTVLDGVTGAGKTEVYFEAVAAALDAGHQVVVMLPEIALSAQWLGRFRARFGVEPAVWHSELGTRQRRETWRAVAEGRAEVVVGARSALWLPFPSLGLIVVDEEHDAAFKQEDGVVYHARDMAVVRARLEGRPAVLVSATPSLESVVNIENGRYGRVRLPDRHGGARLPAIETIDLRETPPERGAWLAPALRVALAETLEAGEQALLFLNRRGYAPLTLCRACGHRFHCPNCSAWLVEHRFAGTLDCHHCGYRRSLPEACPACEAEDRFAACGPGVERACGRGGRCLSWRPLGGAHQRYGARTQPGARPGRCHHGPGGRRAHRHANGGQGASLPAAHTCGRGGCRSGTRGRRHARGRAHLSAASSGGRSCRARRAPGRVMLQTYAAEHPVMAALAAGDRDSFMAREAAARETHGLPPFGRLVAVIASGPNEAETLRAASALARTARAEEKSLGFQVLGPAPAPLKLLRGRHRFRLLFKAPRGVRLQPHLRRWLESLDRRTRAHLQVDIDPHSFM